jgi:DNA-binding IclR family transcriptional regulator
MLESKSRVQSIGKVLRLLEVLADSPKGEMSISKLSTCLGWNRTTAYRFLQTLIEEGYVRQVKGSDMYRLTFKIVGLANQMVNKLDIRQVARPYMLELVEEWQINSHLALLDNNEIVFIERIDSNNLLGTKFHIGRRAPVHATAIGKAILASWDERVLVSTLKEYRFRAFNPNTITEIDKFKKELDLIRENGYALDRGEYNYEVNCVASVIKDVNGDIFAGISLSGTKDQIFSHDINELGNSIKEAAHNISIDLGWQHK